MHISWRQHGFYIYSPIDYLHIANKCIDSKPESYRHYSLGLIALEQYFYLFTKFTLLFTIQITQSEKYKLDSLNKFERI